MKPPHRIPKGTTLYLLTILAACGDGPEPLVGIPRGEPYDEAAHTITVSVATTGPVYQGRHHLAIGIQGGPLEPNDTVAWLAPALGDHRVSLWLGPGCSTANGVRLVPAGGSTHYDVTCVGWGYARIRAATTGVPTGPGLYMVFVDGGFDWPSAVLEPNGSSEIALGPGPHWLTLVPHTNCVASNADQSVEVELDQTREISFSVSCR